MSAEFVDILGAGGHASVIAMIAHRLGVREIRLWGEATEQSHSFPDNARLRPVQEAPADAEFYLGFGGLSERAAARERFRKLPPALIDPSAIIGQGVDIEGGTVIFPRVVVNPGARISSDVIVNTGAIVEHDCRIGRNSHVSPGACLSGAVETGDNVHIGAHAVVIPRVIIGAGVTVGAGAVVISNVSAGETVVGVPARPLPRR